VQHRGMVVRKRLRSFLLPLALYAVSGSIAAFFLFQAERGERGLEAKRQYKAQILLLNGELASLRNERGDWERRLQLLRDDEIDRDLLDERSRVVLGRVHKNDLVVMLDGMKTPPR
jgi:cell division protein FtsB